MAVFKWFDKIAAAQAAAQSAPPTALEPFDFTSVNPATWRGKIAGKLAAAANRYLVGPLLWVLHYVYPTVYWPWLNLAIVTRDAEVRHVLAHDEIFGVPYGPEMRELGDGADFALGLDGEAHRRQRQLMHDVLVGPNGDYWNADMARVMDLTRSLVDSLIENGAGRIDVFTDYVTRILAETAGRYLGVEAANPTAFAQWSMAVSALLFGDPLGDAKTRQLAVNGGHRLRVMFADALDRTQRNFAQHPGTIGRDKTVIDRLVQLQIDRKGTDEAISDDEIIAMLIGLATGFIPTSTLASVKVIEQLRARPAVLADAVACAQRGDAAGLKAIIKEATRLNSPMAPGQWRIAQCDVVLNPGAARPTKIPQGTVILASTMTAMRDRRRFAQPHRYRTDRDAWGDLVFGSGPHACVGTHMALEQMAQMFVKLFALPALRDADGPRSPIAFAGVFPVRLDMVYDDPAATQSMFLIIAPVKVAITQPALNQALGELGHGATVRADVRAAFDATGIVHFASISTIMSERGLDIVVELNVDGTVAAAIDRLAEKAAAVLWPVFAYSDLGSDADLAACMRRHVVTLHSKPWGATGLDYLGTGEFSVKAIEKQERFAKLAEKILGQYLNDGWSQGNHPMRALTYVRRIFQQDRFQALRGDAQALMQAVRDEGLETYGATPSRRALKLAEYVNATYWGAAKAFFGSAESRILVGPVAAVFLLLGFGLFRIVAPPQVVHLAPLDYADLLGWLREQTWIDWSVAGRALWGWLGILIGALAATVLAVVAAVSVTLLVLRLKERSDVPDASETPLDRVEALGQTEDYPGYAHNHFMALGDFKPGLFRTLIHAVALWGIKMIIIFYYRPGFVVNMGTIHYARWWRLPGTKKSIFFSNYDGSWDSYLEDFITRARWGQTAAWSNWVGFPKTRFLIFDGARDGDRFKRWVRTKQQLVPFWYSRFPHLTTDQIRNNALIHHGLARIQTDNDAREWLRCFGSMPRMENRIETDEVQSIVFRGLGHLKHSALLAVRLPDARTKGLGDWLKHSARTVDFGDHQVMGQEKADAGLAIGTGFSGKQLRFKTKLAQITGIKGLGLDGEGADLPDDAAAIDMLKAAMEQAGLVDRDEKTATFLALSAAGIEKICGDARTGQDLPGNFPPAFRLGMGRRARILGDFGRNAPDKWRWSDTSAEGKVAADAVLILYADTELGLLRACDNAQEKLEKHGGELLSETQCQPAWPEGHERAGRDHFGYRDGISQPVIRGTDRFANGVPERDIVEPGEFILGYQSNQGYFPLSPLVRAEADVAGYLSVPSDRALSRFPDFGLEQSGDSPHDFGRNGSFIVIREIEQHVADFETFTERKADEISGRKKAEGADQLSYRNLTKLVGQEVDADWVKAKLMGRWPNGRPLVNNPVQYKVEPDATRRAGPDVGMKDAAQRRAERDNDFSYGVDDPQGLACPFGAHIRRTNPRDSKQPGDEWEQIITNRHRLLRRGRSFVRDNSEKGLLFVALCTDLERQYEFVQQSWVNAPSFHGLTDEPDPIIGTGAGLKPACPASFSIPTPGGAIKLNGMQSFVTIRAGGYFFLPSRSALNYLAHVAR